MLIGLISDTHIPDHARELPARLRDVFRGVDLILHAGDIYDTSVLDELQRMAPVLAAKGDDDPYTTRDDPRVKMKHVLKLDGITLWLTHDRPWSWGDDMEASPNVIVFGHTHSSLLMKRGEVLLVNPGSATFPHYRPEPGTVALLTVGSGKAEANIVYLQPRAD